MSLPDILHKLRKRSWRERRLLPEALLWLGVMRLAVLLVPFQRSVAFLGLTQVGSSFSLPNPEQTSAAAAIGWAVRGMAARTPWESSCLTQALAGMVMLQRRRVPALLFLGVAKDVTASGNLAAHAWLKCGDAVVTGEGGHDRFAVISSFAGKRCP